LHNVYSSGRVWPARRFAPLVGQAEPTPRLFRLQMAQSYRQCVGGVTGFRDFIHRQKSANHFLYLPLVGVTIAGHRRLYFARGVAVHRNVVLGRSQQDNSAHLCQPKRSAHIQGREYGFDGQGIRRILLNKPRKQFVHILKRRAAIFLSALGGYDQRAETQNSRISPIAFHYTITGRAGRRRIHSEHAESLKGLIVGNSIHGHKSTAFAFIRPENFGVSCASSVIPAAIKMASVTIAPAN
jgi:hypothetical protein